MAIANRLSRVVYKILSGDKYKDIGYGRADPHEQKIKGLISQLKAMGVSITHQDKEIVVSRQTLKVDSSGIILS